jgi:CubicO group peptidase (beta-lactamase class C family)
MGNIGMRLALTIILAFFVIDTTSPKAAAQAVADRTLAPHKAETVDKAVNRVMKEEGLVGVTIGVIQNGRIAYLQAYGWADRERRIPAKVATVINWASNSKPMAAILAMQLAEKGLLDLDGDVRKYVPEFPDKGAVITCRQILCHQSGIPHYTNGKIVPALQDAASRRSLLDPIRSLERFSESPLIFEPGEKSSYSSYAYILLSAVIERTGKQSYDAQVRDRISVPLQLKTLQLDHRSPGANWATGYVKKGGRIVPAPEEANDWKFGAGGYKSDVRDFARWATALLNHRLVSEKTERMMWTQQKTKGGEATDFGLGFAIEDGKQGLKASHNGSQSETATRMVLYPKSNSGVVVMSNCNFAQVGVITTAIYSALHDVR